MTPQQNNRCALDEDLPAHTESKFLDVRGFNRRVNSVALFGFLGSGNIGNDASLEVLVQWLDVHSPSTAVTLITNEPEMARVRFNRPAIPMNLYPPLGPQGWRYKFRRGIGRLADVPRLITLVGQFDAVVVPGMGVFEESLPVGPWGFPTTLALLANACRMRNTPLWFLGIGAEAPVDQKLAQLFGFTARHAQFISCRDQGSAEAISSWTHSSHPIHPDIVFAHQAFDDRHLEQPGHVVLGLMGGDWESAYLGRHPIKTDYLTTLEAVCLELIDQGYTITLTGGDQADIPVAHLLLERIVERESHRSRRVSISEDRTFEELARTVASAEFVIASRYHNLVCSLGFGRPTIALAYAPKCFELMDDFGQGAFGYDIRSANQTELVSAIHHLVKESRTIQTTLLRRREILKRRVTDLLDDTLPPGRVRS